MGEGYLHVRSEPQATVASLVELAVASDDPAELIATAGSELGRPLGLVDQSGRILGRAPSDDLGERAVSIARAAARNPLIAPPGWSVTRLVCRRLRFGALAIGDAAGDPNPIVRLLPTLLTDQLRRATLVRLQRAAFVRRLVTPPLPPDHLVRREAAELGIELADAYWPAVLTWRLGTLAPEAIDSVERGALALAERTLSAQLAGRLVLLHPVGAPSTDDRGSAAAWFAEAARLAAEVAPTSRAQAIAADEPAGVDGLSAATRRLARLAGLARADRRPALAWAREYALDELLAGQVDADVARRFVDTQVGALLAFDREHGTNLLGVVEAGLDFPRHDRAARRCFMHRNTFRHRLGQAAMLLDGRLDRPEQRLAVHVAIKLHRTAPPPAADVGPAPRRPPRR